MSFEINYGAWIKEKSGDTTTLVAIKEEAWTQALRESLERSGGDVDQAIASLKAEVVKAVGKS